MKIFKKQRIANIIVFDWKQVTADDDISLHEITLQLAPMNLP